MISCDNDVEFVPQVPELRAGQDVILPIESPIKPTGHIQILYGNLAPEGSVAKITGATISLTATVQLRVRCCCALDERRAGSTLPVPVASASAAESPGS